MVHSVLRVAAVAALCGVAAYAGNALAQSSSQSQTVDAGPAPVIRIAARSANVVIQTWDRPQIKIDSSQGVRVVQFGPRAVDRALPGGDVAIFETQIATPRGVVRLPQEDFPVDGIAGIPHGGVAIFGGNTGASVVITAPANSPLVLAEIGRGSIGIDGYHGAMVTQLHNGDITISNSGGQAYVEAARGSIRVDNSSFARIRARTAVGNVFFTGCNVHQIEVDAVRGEIAYDNGTFEPGLARFQTQQGNIAIGVARGGVQIGAHSGTGRIVSDFGRTTGSDTQQNVNGGGPVVTVNSPKGAVFLYNGTLRDRPQIARRFTPLLKAKTCVTPHCRP